jgi:DNA-binding cell septation regulator SpoVG
MICHLQLKQTINIKWFDDMEKGEENMDGEDGLFVSPPNRRIITTRCHSHDTP